MYTKGVFSEWLLSEACSLGNDHTFMLFFNEPSILENLKLVKLSSDFLRVLLGIQRKEQSDTRHPMYLCGVEMTRRCSLS